MSTAKNKSVKINGPSFFVALMSVFAAAALFDFFFHGMLMAPLYDKAHHVLRSPSEMSGLMPLITLIQFITSAFLILLFIALNVGEGLLAGLRFGALAGLLLGFTQVANYPLILMPLPMAAAWFTGTIVKTLILCTIIGLIYKREVTAK